MMDGTFGIRRVGMDDAETLTKLEAACFSEPWSKEAMQSFLENPCSRAVLLEKNDIAVGFGCMYCLTGEAEIADLAVLPAYRSNGFGAALVQAMLDTATEAGSAAQIFLEVRRSNTHAILLYEKMGFLPYSVRKNYYHAPKEDAILMVRKGL